MTDEKKNDKPNATAAGIAGAVIGAGVAVAATKILSDKTKRDKLVKTLTDVKDQVIDTMHQLRDDAVVAKKKTETKAIEGKKELKEELDKAEKPTK